MKSKKLWLYGLAALGCILLMWWAESTNYYLNTRPYEVEVVEKYKGVSDGKHAKMEFIGVYRTTDGMVFDRYLSAATYFQTAVGDKFTMDLKPMDIKQSTKENLVFFFGHVILMAILFVASCFCIWTFFAVLFS